MSRPELGLLKRVDVHEAWPHEASDFTPWLARSENIALLGETIGLDLEVEGEEVAVGPFSADILCKDTTTGHYVVVENQRCQTDHRHLDQLLTYAAGFDAVTVVWIAAQFSEQHRAALDWRNRVTNESIDLFGLEIELWLIGNSPLAPKFNTFSRPNSWQKTVTSSTGSSGQLS